MPISKLTTREIVNCVGGHPSRALGIDLDVDSDDGDAQLGRWLVAVCLAGARVDEANWLRAFTQLDRAGLSDPRVIANGAESAQRAVDLTTALLEAEYPDAERAAWKLMRVSAALVEGYGGSVDALAQSADSLEELGGRLAALAPGFGAASVGRFLRPLRDRWAQASDLPLHPTACAAAVHLGYLSDGEDLEGACGTLRSAIATSESASPDAPHFRDAEAALEHLGSWCRRNRIKTCPLADRCPARSIEPRD